MRQALQAVLAVLALAAFPALGGDEETVPLELKVEERLPEARPEPEFPRGYAFDDPETLADQRLWGIAHGARLLALACARHGHVAAAEAWVNWREREASQIAELNARLGRHYFRRDDVPLDAIAGALGLRQSLDLPPEQLEPACTTLAEALAQERYDLARRREGMLKNE